MRFLSCCELCCKLTTAVQDLPRKTLSPCTTSLPQTPEIWSPLLYGCSFSFLQTTHFHSPYLPVGHKSPLKLPCSLALCLAPQAPLYPPLLLPTIPPQPSLLLCTADSPTALRRSPVTIKHEACSLKPWI